MNQTISVSIRGKFPKYKIKFSASPEPVPSRSKATFAYTIESKGFRVVGINTQREPFETKDELTWAIPADRQSVILFDDNKDRRRTVFGFEIVFEDAAGNQFSSTDPQVENEGFPPLR